MTDKPKYKISETIMITPMIEAYISAILIRKGSVRYELTHLDDFTPVETWFDEEHIERILFKTASEVS